MNYTQSFSTVFNRPSYFQTTLFGGSDPPITGYPEFAEGEAIKVVAGGGPGGMNCLDVDTTSENASTAGLVILGIGPLANGQWNGTKGCVKWKQQFNSTYNTQCGGYEPIIYLVAGPSSSGANAINLINDYGTLTLNFFTFGPGGTLTASMPTLDNAFHDMQLEWQCCVPNVNYNDGDTSGFINLKIDGVLIYEALNIKLFLSGGAPYDNTLRGLWFGFYGMLGKVAAVSVTDALCGAVVVPIQPSKICVPQTSVTTPARNAGCNLGGVGYSATYVGGSGGMPVGPDPLDGERLTGKRALNVWAEVTHANY